MSQITKLFDKTFRHYGERRALLELKRYTKTQWCSYSQVAQDCDAALQFLIEMGVKPHDKILTFTKPSYQLIVLMIAAWRLGAVIMYVDFWANQERLKLAFDEVRPQFVVTSRLTRVLQKTLREMRQVKTLKIEQVKRRSQHRIDRTYCPKDTDIALITMTTGSSGKPLAAIRTHAHLMAQLELIRKNLASVNLPRTILTTSFMYVFANLANGDATIVPKGRIDNFKKIKHEPISTIISTPDFCLRHNADDFSRLKEVYFGGAILNYYEARQIRQNFPKSRIEYIYGATECNLITKTDLDEYINNLEKHHRAILGRPVKGVELTIGQDADILVSSQALLAQYTNHFRQNKLRHKNRLWHKTGDVGKYEHGYLEYLGRSKNYLMIAQQKIYTFEVECAITLRFPYVTKCACLQEHRRYYLVVEPKMSQEQRRQIQAYLNQRYNTTNWQVVNQKIPCDVKHHTKIDYTSLRKIIKRRFL